MNTFNENKQARADAVAKATPVHALAARFVLDSTAKAVGIMAFGWLFYGQHLLYVLLSLK